MSTVKYLSNHREHRYELVDEPKINNNNNNNNKEKQPKRIYIDKKFETKLSWIQTKGCHLNQRTISIDKNKEFFSRRKHANTI